MFNKPRLVTVEQAIKKMASASQMRLNINEGMRVIALSSVLSNPNSHITACQEAVNEWHYLMKSNGFNPRQMIVYRRVNLKNFDVTNEVQGAQVEMTYSVTEFSTVMVALERAMLTEHEFAQKLGDEDAMKHEKGAFQKLFQRLHQMTVRPAAHLDKDLVI